MPTPRLGSTRYAIVGTGSRATMYIDAICGQYAAHCDLVALCDTSSVRMAYHNKRLAALYERDEVPDFPGRTTLRSCSNSAARTS